MTTEEAISKTTYQELDIADLSPQVLRDTAFQLDIPSSFEEKIPTFLEYIETAVHYFLFSHKYDSAIVAYHDLYKVEDIGMVYWVQFTNNTLFMARKRFNIYLENANIIGYRCQLLPKKRGNTLKSFLTKKAQVPLKRLPLLINHESFGIQLFARYKLSCPQ